MNMQSSRLAWVRTMIRRAFAKASKVAFNVVYKACAQPIRRREVLFLSRQTDSPSYDFAQLAEEFERRGWKTTMHLKKVTARRIASYAIHVVKELKYLGRASIAVLDRYDPVVSLLDFECDQMPGRLSGQDDASPAPCNVEFPIKPIVFQMWHAFGAFKKFGFQSVDTPEGHSSEFTDTFNIHRNYSWVMCSGEGARKAFSEAFSRPLDRVVAFDRPEYDELAHLRRVREEAIAENKLKDPAQHKVKTILMAPTLRINKSSDHPFRDLYETRQSFEAKLDANVSWSFHPLETGLPAPGNVSEQLLGCTLVVTDYSSIVYEAYLLGIPVVFYVPDLESYRESPGLNADPLLLSPQICATTSCDLVELLRTFTADEGAYPFVALERFAGSSFIVNGNRENSSAASRIADFLIASCQPSSLNQD